MNTKSKQVKCTQCQELRPEHLVTVAEKDSMCDECIRTLGAKLAHDTVRALLETGAPRTSSIYYRMLNHLTAIWARDYGAKLADKMYSQAFENSELAMERVDGIVKGVFPRANNLQQITESWFESGS
jgi:hypothetical protein